MIGLYGPAYSKILLADAEDDGDEMRGSLQARTQVQLKDKARNIKFAYLKSEEQVVKDH